MNWSDFLRSLETEGGERALIVCMLLWLGMIAFVMHETGHDPAETGKVLLSNSFTALFTLFLAKMGGKKT